MSDETQHTPQEPSGPSRRALLKGAAVGVGAAWVAPVIISIDARSAAASGVFTTVQTGTTGSSGAASVTVNTPGTGGVLIAVVVVQSQNQTIAAPAGWTPLFATTLHQGLLSMQVFARVNSSAPNYQFTWTDAGRGSAFIALFTGSTTWSTASSAGNVGSAISSGSQTTTGTGNNALFIAGVASANGTIAAPPSGYAAQTGTGVATGAGPNGAVAYLATQSVGAATLAPTATSSAVASNFGVQVVVR